MPRFQLYKGRSEGGPCCRWLCSQGSSVRDPPASKRCACLMYCLFRRYITRLERSLSLWHNYAGLSSERMPLEA